MIGTITHASITFGDNMDTQAVPFERIVADPDVWPRDRLNEERVEDFCDLYRSDGPSALPPLSVVEVADGYLLADGWHRFAALAELERSTAPVVFLETGGRDGRAAAYEEGLRSCAATSLPLTKAERHAAILRLTIGGGRTDREIARLVGVSHQTVSRIRAAAKGGPLDQVVSDAAAAEASSFELSRRLARGARRIWDARGVTDLIASRMPQNLADALVAEFGVEEALTWARRLSAWATAAVIELEIR